MEVFKTIPSFPDYLVSNCGRVKTKARPIRYIHAVTKKEHFRKTEERFLKVHPNRLTGYKMYQLYKDKKMYNKPIHQLVADAFLIRDDLKKDNINHINGNKHDNTVENLEWVTSAYNHYHATITGLKPRGERIGTSKLTDSMVHAIKWFLKKKVKQNELAKAFQISLPTIAMISRGRIWKHISLTESKTNLNHE